MSPKFQKFRGRFKTAREDRKLSAEISKRQLSVGRSGGNSKKPRNIEKFGGKTRFVAENLQLLRKSHIFGRSENLSVEDLNCRANI
jgi:hypothetical protein